jgi:hypothetical protein
LTSKVGSEEVSRLINLPMGRLLAASALSLFLELACIRWTGSHVLYLSYVSNFVLLSCFLGLGLGCLVSGAKGDKLLPWGPALLLAVVALVVVSDIEVLVEGSEVVYYRSEHMPVALPPWLVLPLLGLLNTAVFACLGAAIGRELGRARPLTAYSVDIAGSLLGIMIFGLCSWQGVRAEVWFALAGVAWLFILPCTKRVLLSAGVAALLVSGLVAFADAGSIWSPYYRVIVEDRTAVEKQPAPSFRLRVNQITHQRITDARLRGHFYEFPYRAAGASIPGLPEDAWLTEQPVKRGPLAPGDPEAKPWGGRVMIIGAGGGTDVSVALAYGASHVDAVEIDPVIATLGRKLNPNRPYADPRVTVHIADGRTYLERAEGPYDLILFALTDSLTLASPYATTRLESFVYTRNAMTRARELLHPERGLLVLYNFYREPWLVQKLALTMNEAFERPPKMWIGPHQGLTASLMAGPGLDKVDANLQPPAKYKRAELRPELIEERLPLATDDWPFLYLKHQSVPGHLGTTMLIFVGLAVLLVGLAMGRRSGLGRFREIVRIGAPFFFMGAAFLLLETSGLVRMSLNFGSTWMVNALVFFAVLCVVLLANFVAAKLPLRSRKPIYALLFASLALAWSVPPSALAAQSALVRYLGASLLMFLPIFFANLLFAREFRDQRKASVAFGANLLGAVVGGALEYTALIVGFQALFVVAAVLYTGAALSSYLEGRAEA